MKIDGIAYIRALTTIRMPCHRDMARRGRNARRVRNDLSTFKFSFSSIKREKTDTFGQTEKKILIIDKLLYGKLLPSNYVLY